MSHLLLLPILIPLVAAALLLVMQGLRAPARRAISGVAAGMLIVVALLLLREADTGAIQTYRLGNWPAPFGIVLVLDRLAALMVCLTAGLAVIALLTAFSGADEAGRHFHVFFQFQLAGLNGAFLTGDLFNLFVFFEILLLASYVLLAHGGGLERSRAGLAYVILNLAGSSLFLVALGLIYGTLGTLTMADLVDVLPRVVADDRPLVRTALVLMTAVFVLKAALLPLGFWLPHVYTATVLPVSVLFVIMTKVGIYALLRLSTIGLQAAPFTADLLHPWLAVLAIATIILGSLGVLAARRLGVVFANVVMISSGTLLLGVAAGGVSAHAASLYYLISTTVVTAGLFQAAAMISRHRGATGDALETGPRLANALAAGGALFVLSVAASGMPPLSGFLAKIMLMQALAGTSLAGTSLVAAAWAVLIASGFLIALVMARSASVIFWEARKPAAIMAGSDGPLPAPPAWSCAGVALTGTLVILLFITLAAAPISGFTKATAEQLARPAAYVEAILGRAPAMPREKRP